VNEEVLAQRGLLRQIKKNLYKIDRPWFVITHYIDPGKTKCDSCPQIQPDTRMSIGNGRSSSIGQIIANNTKYKHLPRLKHQTESLPGTAYTELSIITTIIAI
jgi:hypothetical protein